MVKKKETSCVDAANTDHYQQDFIFETLIRKPKRFILTTLMMLFHMLRIMMRKKTLIL